VLAITFTRKAAQEMRERLIGALEQAATTTEADSARLTVVERRRRALALPVLARDRAHEWHLREQPDRLQIDTFDAFCARVVARSNLSRIAGEGALGSVTDAADGGPPADDTTMVSTHQPVEPTEVSVARRKRNWVGCENAAGGRLTCVVMKLAWGPLQA